MALPFPLSVNYANRLRQHTSEEELRSLVLELTDYIEKNPKDLIDSMILLIKCYYLLDDIENAEIIFGKCSEMLNGELPFELAMLKTTIEASKGNSEAALEILRHLLKNATTEYEKAYVLSHLATSYANMSYYEEMYQAILELWNMVNHNYEIDFDDNVFYAKISQYFDPRPLISIMTKVKSYLNGKALLKNKMYSDIYEYVKESLKDNQAVYEIFSFEDIDIEFPDEKYFSLKIIAKPMSIEEQFNLEIYIYKLIISKYPGILVLVRVLGR
ncbi:MAG: hypothetical protein L7F77_02550 [Candidatus Magnetominusculus sp. LBB02]|nr:hypothetical protein [Candidatus Magnetominusculus sp. LBB02]